jgi:hypothetical protein
MSVFTNAGSSTPEQSAAYTAAIIDLLGSRDPVQVLEQTPSRLSDICEGLSPDLLTRPEGPGKWSVRHVIQHLVDSEIVWAFRFRMVLAHDRPDLHGYDQDLWAESTGYADVRTEDALMDFSTLRQMNLRLLARLPAADLERTGIHVERGEESIAFMIRLYAGHDLLHLRQIGRIRKTLV